MNNLMNNALFWQKLDILLVTSTYKKMRSPKQPHPLHPNLIYPVEYGYLMDSDNPDKIVSKVFKGTSGKSQCEQVMLVVDILTKEMDVKLLVGCTEDEIIRCLEFSNQTNFQKSVLIRRGDALPFWASNE